MCKQTFPFGPRQANLVLIVYASSEGSGDPAHPRSLARTSTARSYKQWVKRNLQTESQIPGPSEWLGIRSYNLSWRNARRHKFAWRGSFTLTGRLLSGCFLPFLTLLVFPNKTAVCEWTGCRNPSSGPRILHINNEQQYNNRRQKQIAVYWKNKTTTNL